ncbi:MAG: NAD(P)-dependent oxidoreductase [Sedimentisphaerales bacterium]|nr:NAD(P)-dependent oxidoreductase [Sedimentisphaerales bacterium]
MNIFLTGGTGFIGSYVAVELVGQGHDVTILARNPDKVPALKKIDRIDIVGGCITDLDLLEKLVAGKDACIHIALNYTRKTGWEVLQDDTLPTVYLSDMAAKANVKHFIYTSSTAANDSLYMGGADDQDEPIKCVTKLTKQRPATFYGATKAASENYLMAQSYLTPMRINIIRPGYTFGNPVVEGGSIQGDTRFLDIVKNALENKPITVIKNDGTQFIWAGDLAKLYVAVLNSDVNRKTYFGLAPKFISWYAVAQEAVKQTGSKSRINLDDRGWSDDGLMWDVSDMKNDFGLESDPWDKIVEHVAYYIELLKGT